MRFVLSVDNDNEFRSRCEWSHENPYFGVSKLAISSKSMRIFFILGRKRSILFRCASTGLGAKNLAAVMLAHADVCACVCGHQPFSNVCEVQNNTLWAKCDVYEIRQDRPAPLPTRLLFAVRITTRCTADFNFTHQDALVGNIWQGLPERGASD